MIQLLLHIIEHIICYDIWFYFSHIALHNPSLYWMHKKHHSVPYDQLQFTDATVASIWEHAIQPLGFVVPCLFSIYDPEAIIITIGLLTIRGGMRHDKRCVCFVGDHHLAHHQFQRYNFGEYWLDWALGTNLNRQNFRASDENININDD